MDQKKHSILYDNTQLGPYPLEKLPRVDRITSTVYDDTVRPWQKDHQLNKLVRGDYGEALAKRAANLSSHNPLCEAIWSTLPHIANMPLNPVAEQKAPLPEDLNALTRHIKRYTYFLGAEQVGICKVPPRTVYWDDHKGNMIDKLYEYAIVFLLRKDPKTVEATHGDEWIDDAASWRVYQGNAVIAATLARYIRSLGYPARASHCANYITLMPRLVVEAGLGEFSRMGIALNPFIGAQFKAACVLTDLPLVPDKPIDFGLQDYCEHCRICAQQCPTGALPMGGKVDYNGYHDWVQDREKCAKYCVTSAHGDICQRCTKVCPFNRPDGSPEQFKDWDGNLDYLYELVNKQRKHIVEHDFVEPAEADRKWWLPIRECDGVMQEMPEYDYQQHYSKMEKLKAKGIVET